MRSTSLPANSGDVSSTSSSALLAPTMEPVNVYVRKALRVLAPVQNGAVEERRAVPHGSDGHVQLAQASRYSMADDAAVQVRRLKYVSRTLLGDATISQWTPTGAFATSAIRWICQRHASDILCK